MKMIHKSVAILTIDDKTDNDTREANKQYLMDQLTSLFDYKIQRISSVSHENNALIQDELDACVKNCDLNVVLVGAHPESTYEAVANVFHQPLELRSCVRIPKHARVLGYDSGLPVIYLQSVIVMPTEKCVDKTFEVVALFLEKLARKVRYEVSLTFSNVRDTEGLPLWDNIGLVYEDGIGGKKVTVTSGSFCNLFAYVEGLGDLIDSQKGAPSVTKQVYSQTGTHIRNSIRCIEECLEKYGPENIFVCFNGGKDCTVLLHLTLGVLRRKYPEFQNKLPCLYIENSNPFAEVQNFIAQCQKYYDFELIKIQSNTKEALEVILSEKPHMRACLMGTRRTDPFSQNLQPFQMTDEDWPQAMRVSPLLDWHYSEIWDYLLVLKVPYCCLYDMGYTSLGNVGNTVRNPSLLCKKGNAETYLQAYKLLDASKERNGRQQS